MEIQQTAHLRCLSEEIARDELGAGVVSEQANRIGIQIVILYLLKHLNT